MKIVKQYDELAKLVRIREEEIVLIDGIAEDVYEKFTTDDARIYGALSGNIDIPTIMINMLFGNVEIFKTLNNILIDYNWDYNADKNQVLLFLKEELKK